VVQHSVDVPVAARVVAMTYRRAVALSGRGWDRSGAVEPREAAFGEPAHVADLDQQLGGAAVAQSDQLGQRGAGLADQPRELFAGF
jgi:hypothetical protein